MRLATAASWRDPRHRSEIESERMHTRRPPFVPEAATRLRPPLEPACKSPAHTFTRPASTHPHTPPGDASRTPNDGSSPAVHGSARAALETCINSAPSSRPPFQPSGRPLRRIGCAAFGDPHRGTASCNPNAARGQCQSLQTDGWNPERATAFSRRVEEVRGSRFHPPFRTRPFVTLGRGRWSVK